jgi:hypothetical protein
MEFRIKNLRITKANDSKIKKSSRIVLAPPYSGVIFWMLSSSALNRPARIAFDEQHSYFNMYGGYFRNVLGQNPIKIFDEVISLTLLYDRLILAPTDIHLPNYKGSPGRYEDLELGIVMDWQWRLEISQLLDQTKITDWLLFNSLVQQLVQSTPDRSEVVWNCVVLLYISHKFKASIAGSKSTIQLLKIIKSLLFTRFSNSVEFVPSKESAALNNLFDIGGLCFRINDIDEYKSLRLSKPLKHYGNSFRNFLDSLSEGKPEALNLYESMMEAIETDEIADKISGGLSISASILGIASLIPVVGTFTGLAGIFSDFGGRASQKKQRDNHWWTLAPEISQTLTKHRISQKMEQLRKYKQ